MCSLITFITKEDEKASQIKDVLGTDFTFQILHLKLNDYQGTETYALTEKCKEALSHDLACPIVTDITSVCFNAFDGLPGLLISSFLPKLTSAELYKLLDGWEDKSAYVIYTLGLLEKEDTPIQFFQGCISGTMVPPTSPTATGWEACFQPDGYSKAYADLPKEVRKEISERRKALRPLKTFLISEEFFM